jgi:imidazolonepropionase-like amidohydrolase/ectoine hydroxylase-related dioxygenase (phytanoyl-CoA dioxygenase family)
MPVAADLEQQLAGAVAEATGGSWKLTRCWSEKRMLCLTAEVPAATRGRQSSLLLEVRTAQPGARAYRVVGDLSFSYRHDDRVLSREQLKPLDRVVSTLAVLLSRHDFSPIVEELPAGEGGAAFPTPYHRAYLDDEAALPAEVVEAYRRNGHVLVRRALQRDVVLAARPCLLGAVEGAWPKDLPPVEQRKDAYSQSFTQITDLGLTDPRVRIFSHARRLARMAAELMGVEGVRCFCEDWLVKEPGARITPWHQDEAVFPFEAAATITCWVPLQDVGPEDGLLRFARGSHQMGIAPIEDISDVSEAEFARIIEDQGFPIDELPPVFVGDVSFHDGRMIHGAFPNRGERSRMALALHCFADGARVKRPTTPKMAAILSGSAPGRSPGDLAVSDSWPLLLGGDRGRPTVTKPRVSGPRFRLRARVLPEGSDVVDIWIAEGRLRFDPVEGAQDLTACGEFLTSGLVDCHAHISYPHERGEPADSPAWMNARRAEYAATGTTLLRDMGAVSDAISSLLDVAGLPRVHCSGTMILRHDDFPFTRTDPEQLVRACAERVERGARWVKIFADWSSDYRGRINSGFTGDDDLTYPRELLEEAVAAVHALGGRVAVHAFTRAGAVAAIAAGVDSLEHGWGVDEGLVEQMAERRVAWVPLVGIAPAMWRIARRDGQPDRAAWIERTMSSLARVLPLAHRRGVWIFAGTDLFPEVTVADEIRQLHELGLDRSACMSAGTWGARDWLGEPGLTDGAIADFVLYAADPRADLGVLLRPEVIFVGGERVTPSLARVRPRFVSWAERD